MANNRTFLGFPVSAACAFFALIGCGGDDSSTASGTAAELAAASTNIADTTQSQDAAGQQVKGCFDAFRTCEQTAGKGAQTCRDALKACLPAQPPMPPGCDMAKSDGGNMPARGDAGSRKSHGDMDDRDSDDDDDGMHADGGVRPLAKGPHGDGGARVHGDGGVPHADADRDDDKGRGDHGDKGKGDRDDHEGHGGPMCGRPAIPEQRFAACSDVSTTQLSQGGDPMQASTAHQQCVKKAFGERLDELCKHAATLCARADAPKDKCDTITQACKTVATPAP